MINDPILVNDWHPVGTVQQLAENSMLKVRLLGEDLVVWRADGEVRAWQDLCIHRGARLSLGKVKGDTLACAYHGWVYNGEGACIHIPAHPDQLPPAKARAKSYQAQICYDLIWVCLGEPRNAIPIFPEWADSAYRKLLCGPYKIKAHGPRIIENFLDVGHFPFVHEGILGVQTHPEIADYTAEIGPHGVEAKGVRVYQPDPYGTGVGDYVAYTYRVLRPLTAYLLKESEGPSFSIFVTITSHEPLQSSMWMWMAMNYGHDLPAADLIAWQDSIAFQDVPVVESQRPELLPLDLQAELHLRSDRTAIAYRKWLNELGLSFGTA